VEEELHRLGRPGPGQKGPPGHLVHHDVGIGAVDIEAPGGVTSDSPEGLPRLGDGRHHLGVVADPQGAEVSSDDRFRSGAQDRLQAEVGQSLGDKALGGADEKDGFLQPSSAPDETDLLTTMLGVVSRIGLMGHQMGQ